MKPQRKTFLQYLTKDLYPEYFILKTPTKQKGQKFF